MSLFSLITLVFCFVALSAYDAYFTLRAIGHLHGALFEENPVLGRAIIKSRSLFLQLKAIFTSLFIFTLFAICKFYPGATWLAWGMMILFIALYTIIIYHNLRIINELVR